MESVSITKLAQDVGAVNRKGPPTPGTINCESCRHPVFHPGVMSAMGPRSMGVKWGYLPGDEPGPICRLSELHINEEEFEMPVEDCWLRSRSETVICPECLEDVGETVFAFFHKETGMALCPDCGHEWQPDEALEKEMGPCLSNR